MNSETVEWWHCQGLGGGRNGEMLANVKRKLIRLVIQRTQWMQSGFNIDSKSAYL